MVKTNACGAWARHCPSAEVEEALQFLQVEQTEVAERVVVVVIREWNYTPKVYRDKPRDKSLQRTPVLVADNQSQDKQGQGGSQRGPFTAQATF